MLYFPAQGNMGVERPIVENNTCRFQFIAKPPPQLDERTETGISVISPYPPKLLIAVPKTAGAVKNQGEASLPRGGITDGPANERRLIFRRFSQKNQGQVQIPRPGKSALVRLGFDPGLEVQKPVFYFIIEIYGDKKAHGYSLPVFRNDKLRQQRDQADTLRNY
jgi:hypothetical protein